MKTVGVLLATFNGQRFLKQLLLSLFEQSYSSIVLYVCDDCSDDGTVSLLKTTLKHSPFRVRLFTNHKNLGVNKTFQRLLLSAETDYVAFCDQDDIWKREKVEKCVVELQRKNVSLVYSDLEILENNSFKGSFMKYKGFTSSKVNIYKNQLTGCSMLAKRDALLQSVPFSKHGIYDRWIYSTTFQTVPTSFIDERLVLYRFHDNNFVPRSRSSLSWKRIIAAVENNVAFYLDVCAWYKSMKKVLPSNLHTYCSYLDLIRKRKVSLFTLLYLNRLQLTLSLASKILLFRKVNGEC